MGMVDVLVSVLTLHKSMRFHSVVHFGIAFHVQDPYMRKHSSILVFDEDV